MKTRWVVILSFLIFPLLGFATEKIDINSASLGVLEELKGIGPTYAQRIIDGRPFLSVDDLLKVNGIGEKTLQGIKDQGLACVNCVTVQIPTSQELQNTNPVVYPAGVVINKILPNPEGADETEEFIELHNTTNAIINISGWKLQDIQGVTASYTFPENTTLLALGTATTKRDISKILLNNEGDGVSLLTPDNVIVDTVNYLKAPLGQPYKKINNEWHWNDNKVSIAKKVVQTATENILPNKKESVTNNGVNYEPADINEPISIQTKPEPKNPWVLFYIVLGITSITAIGVIYIKFIVLKKYVRT